MITAPVSKIRGLLLTYGYCEEERRGVDPWVLHNYDEHWFEHPWDAISSLATVLYQVYVEDRQPIESKECCAGWSTLTNKDAFTTLVLAERGLNPDGRLTQCPICRYVLDLGDYNYEYMRSWLLNEYDTTPGSGQAYYEGHEDIWCRDISLDYLLDPQYYGSWYVINGADLVLSLGMPTSVLPQDSVKSYVEDFENNFHSLDDDLKAAFKTWGGK